MTPQDVVTLAPPRGLLAMIAMMLTAMAACFWTDARAAAELRD